MPGLAAPHRRLTLEARLEDSRRRHPEHSNPLPPRTLVFLGVLEEEELRAVRDVIVIEVRQGVDFEPISLRYRQFVIEG